MLADEKIPDAEHLNWLSVQAERDLAALEDLTTEEAASILDAYQKENN